MKLYKRKYSIIYANTCRQRTEYQHGNFLIHLYPDSGICDVFVVTAGGQGRGGNGFENFEKQHARQTTRNIHYITLMEIINNNAQRGGTQEILLSLYNTCNPKCNNNTYTLLNDYLLHLSGYCTRVILIKRDWDKLRKNQFQ